MKKRVVGLMACNLFLFTVPTETLSQTNVSLLKNSVLVIGGGFLALVFATASLVGLTPQKLSAFTALFAALSTGTIIQQNKELEKLRQKLSLLN